MSVVGFDFGNMNSVIAVAQKGGIDIIANEVSNRETPSMVGFGPKERYAGEAAQSQYMMNFRNTITDIKRLVGRKWNEPEVQEELKRLPFKTKELPEGRIGVEVNYAGENQTFSVEQILAVLFQKLKKTSEMSTATKVVDVVISVPIYFTNFQRRAVKDAASIAGLNVLRLINEPTATGLAYGFFKTLADNEVLKVLFYDMGQSATTAAVVQFEKGKMKVLGVAWDRNLGGRNFDEALVDHFAAEFKTKYGLDVKSNPKALLRLRVSCEKLKKTLSANSEAPLNIDSLMNDVDVKAMMNRDEFEKIVTSLLDRAVLPIKQVLEETGVTLEQLHALEIVGMGTRLLSLQKRLTAVLGRELSKTTNAAEAVAKGAALMCASLSPVFKVKQFKVIDIHPFPVQLVVNSLNPSAMETSEESMEIFTRNNQVTSAKDISFYRKASAPFELNTYYPNLENLPPGTDPAIAKFQITNIPTTPNGEEAKVEVRVKLDGSCFVNVEHAHALETYEETVVETPTTPATPPTPSTPTTPAENKPEEAPATPTAEPQTPPAQPAEAQTKKVKKVRRHEVKLTSHFFGAMSPQELQNAIDIECKMVAQDKLAWETAEKKNQLESYIYDMREKINGAWKAYFTEKEAETLTKQLQEAEDWLYGDGEDVTKSVYAGKLDSLKVIGDKGTLRYRESEERPNALKELNAALATYRNFAASTDAKYEHIEKADRDKVTAECDATEKAINDQLAAQNSSPKNVDPVLTSADILRKRDALERFCKPIVNKPKPTPPPKPAEPTPAPAPAAGANAGAAPEQPKENGAKADTKSGENMDTSS